MNREEMLSYFRKVVCGVEKETECEKCIKNNRNSHVCRLQEKSDEQLEYILSSKSENIYLEACAGSGKTEVLGIKAAYEICAWQTGNTGIAVLTFTNEAANTIADRISQLHKGRISSNHYIGTFSSFVHGYISQKFGCDIFQNQRTDKDKSFRIVDGDISQYDNNWLNTFKVEFPLNPKHPLYANSLYFKTSNRTWYTGQKETDVSLLDYYNNAGKNLEYKNLLPQGFSVIFNGETLTSISGGLNMKLPQTKYEVEVLCDNEYYKLNSQPKVIGTIEKNRTDLVFDVLPREYISRFSNSHEHGIVINGDSSKICYYKQSITIEFSIEDEDDFNENHSEKN